jgi:hypothetical protein
MLSASQGYVVDSIAQVVTDGTGSASWGVRCTVEGATSLPLTVAGGVTTVNLPACVAAPAAPAPTTTKAP